MGVSNRSAVILVGDIGGTKTNISYLIDGADSPQFQHNETYTSKDAGGLEDILEQYLDKHRIEVKAACFGIAGPVVEGRCKTTNLPWEVSEKAIRRRFGWPRIKLINDLAATALSIPYLSSDETEYLKAGNAVSEQTIALVAPGTGLGQALLVWVEDRFAAVPSEGGHVDFAPTTEEEVSLWHYLHGKMDHVSVERVVSGPGLVNIYAWLKTVRRHDEPEWLKKRLATSDSAAVIAKAGLDGKETLCVEALDRFVSILGSVAGNLALTGFALGGVYLGGGIPPKILPKLKEGLFLQAFLRKGRFNTLLEKIPVYTILNEKAALVGAAVCAARMLGDLHPDGRPGRDD